MEACVRYLWLVPALPLLGAAVLGLAGWRLSRGVVATLACATIGLAFLVSLGASVAVFTGGLHPEAFAGDDVVVHEAAQAAEVTLWEWLPMGERRGVGPEDQRFLANLSVPVSFWLDPLSAVMLLVVTGVGFLIHLFAVGYMWEDGSLWRFFAYLNLFVSMMLVLVSGASFLLMFVGWEGVGLCSYLLIGYYYRQDVPAAAGMKAFLVNRVGDLGFVVGMLLMLLTFGSLQYAEVFPRMAGSAAYAGSALAVATAACLFVGAMGKSAQVPLHVWLPDAMAGPTPVSALIHAATMVTAGVYLVIRANVLFQAAPSVSLAIAVVGVVTALVAASTALVQVDIKRVLAYSTVSQLGYMFLAVGVGAYSAALFHLVTHAFFKALLFLGAGSVSHALGGELDLRKMGGLGSALPHTRRVMLVATLAIAGIPVLSGFWSKDEILAGVITSVLPAGVKWLLWAAALAGALLTAFYMFRMYFLAFGGKPRWPAGAHPHESPPLMVGPLYVLAILAALGGVLGLSAWTSAPNLLEHALDAVVFPGSLVGGRVHLGLGAELGLVAMAVAVAVAGSLLARSWYAAPNPAPAAAAERWPGLRRFLMRKWYFDEALRVAIVQPAMRLARWSGAVDRGVVDLGVELTGLGAAMTGEVLRGLTSGRVRTYALGIVVGAVAAAAWLLTR